MICQGCGVEAATKYVSFHQNIGAVFLRFSSSIDGSLCKSCIHKHFWKMTGTTFFLGWWGTISFIVTPFLLLNNVGRYAMCLGMPGVASDAVPPRLSDRDLALITPHAKQLFERVGRGEDLADVAASTAVLAGVTPGQVMLFVQAVAQQHRGA